MNDRAPPMKPTQTQIEAACAAVILGEDEHGNPVHLQPSEAEAALSAALSVPAAAVVGEPEWWIVTTDMGKVIFHGPDKDRADRVAAMHGREAQPLYAAPCPECRGSSIEFVNGGNGNILEVSCSYCGGNGHDKR